MKKQYSGSIVLGCFCPHDVMVLCKQFIDALIFITSCKYTVNRQVYPLILSEGVYLKYSDVSKQELEKQ